jgi:pyridoxine 5-phosphate synthase
MPNLGVNIDHVATLRQARGATEPDPVRAAVMAELGGADQITIHLREDRRHIQDRDVELLIRSVQTRVNMEMALVDEITAVALKLKPACACLVPERREELTTEGGLNVAGSLERTKTIVGRLGDAGIQVSLFIDPDLKQIEAAAKSGAPFIEMHTGAYANARSEETVAERLGELQRAANEAQRLGLRVNAGHGLNYYNVQPVARIPGMDELNIGHSIIARSVFTGLTEAVREMKRLIG